MGRNTCWQGTRQVIRRTDATTGDHKIIILRHASCRLYYFGLIICNDLYPFQLHAQREAEFCQICRICVHGLLDAGVRISPLRV
jgi:hypothetical protein